MEQRAVIRFLTLKGLHASAIAAELKVINEPEALALYAVKKWRRRFAEGRTSRYDDPRRGSPFINDINDLAEGISFILKERSHFSCKILCQHFRIAKGSCLRIIYDTLGMKSAIFVGFPIPWTGIRRPKESFYSTEFFLYDRALVVLVSRVSSLEVNHGSFCTIPAIRYERRHEMKCQQESVKKHHRKVFNFTSLVCQ
jgi:hypothetical protein